MEEIDIKYHDFMERMDDVEDKHTMRIVEIENELMHEESMKASIFEEIA